MTHPEIVLVPVLMIADYFLTVLGAVWKEKRYSRHFKTEHYELNPLWQKQIAQKKWLNLRHVALTLLISGSLYFLIEVDKMPFGTARGILGFVLVLYGMIVGRHLSNLLIFAHVNRRPEEVSGEVVMSHAFVLFLSLYQTLAVALPVALIAVFSQSHFARGGIAGIGVFLIIHLRWIWKANKQKGSDRRASGGDGSIEQ